MSRDDLSLALRDDPFAGDYGGSGRHDRILRDVIVRTRGGHRCHYDGEVIRAGEMTRHRVEIYDGSLMSFRWCEVCTRMMATGDDAGLEGRIAMGRRALTPEATHG